MHNWRKRISAAIATSLLAGTILAAAAPGASAATKCPADYTCLFDSGSANGNYVITPPAALLGNHLFFCAAGGKACLIMQGDGNLVLYDLTGASPKPEWWTGTNGHPGAYTLLQASDGNLVVYNSSGHALWWVFGSTGDHLSIQIDGNLVLYARDGHAIWQSGTRH